MHTFTRGDLSFDVDDRGSGAAGTVVLLHGFPQNRHEWEGVSARLVEAGCRTLAPDQRGYSPGARPRARRAYRQSELVADVIALIDATGEQKVHLVGHDWGAAIAWALASRHPERLHTLTTVSVPHPTAFLGAMRHGQARKSWYMGLFQLPLLPETLLRSAMGERFLASTGMTAHQARSYLAPLGRDGLTAALNWYRALPFSLREHGYDNPSTVPTTFVWSDADTALGRYGAEATERYVSAPYRFEIMTGLSHWIADEAPDALADLILDRIRGA